MRKSTKYFNLLVLSVILLLVSGCSDAEEQGANAAESDSEECIRTILYEEFSGPDEELKNIFDGLNPNDKEQHEKHEKKLSDYIKENLKPYYSERTYDHNKALISSYIYVQDAYKNGYELQVKNITIEETKNSYKFTVEVTYTNNNSNESETVNIKGLANTNEKGKVAKVSYFNDEKLLDAMEKS